MTPELVQAIADKIVEAINMVPDDLSNQMQIARCLAARRHYNLQSLDRVIDLTKTFELLATGGFKL